MDHPEVLLVLWRFRMMKYKICIATSFDISSITDITYFVSAMCLPNLKIEHDCLFHVDLLDSLKYQTGDWKVCGVTHPIMQREECGDITIHEDCAISIKSKKLNWLKKGNGPILKEIESIIKRNNDSYLFQVFLQLSQHVFKFAEAGASIDQDTLHQIGLDKDNQSFLNAYFQLVGSHAEIEIKCC